MKQFKMLASGADPAPALAELERYASLWDLNTERESYPGTAHKDSQTLYLRAPQIISADSMFYSLEVQDTPALFSLAACGRLLYSTASVVGADQLGRVALVKLAPGGKVEEHVDQGLYADYYTRFHLPLLSDSRCRFYCGDESVWMEPGQLWWFNHRELHHVENNSDQPRIHLIVDAHVQNH